MKKIKMICDFLLALLLSLCADCYVLVSGNVRALWLLVPLFIALNIFPGPLKKNIPGARLRVCGHGLAMLRMFLSALCIALVYHVVLFFASLGEPLWPVLWSALTCFGVLAVAFWNGIICVYCTSVHIGIKWRVIGAVFGMIFPVNLFVLNKIIRTVAAEL